MPSPSANIMKSLKLWQGITFSVSYLAMLARHACLGAWSMSKAHVSTELGFTSSVFGTFDSIYLVFYSVGNFVCGSLGDHFPVRYVMALGLFVASVCYYLIAILGLVRSDSALMFGILFAVGGVAQSGVFPGGVSVMSSWFSQSVRGRVMGFWSMSSSSGDALGQIGSGFLFGVLVMTWEGVMTVFTSLLLLSGVLCLFFLFDRPLASVTFASRDVSIEEELMEQLSFDEDSPRAIGFWKAFFLPGVLLYGLAFACAKLLQYALFLWLPYYLKSLDMDDTTIGIISFSCDIGGIAGSIFVGYLSDRFRRRGAVCAALLLLSIPLLMAFKETPANNTFLYIVLAAVVGALTGGPANIISSACAADLATRGEAQFNRKALSTVTGIIDGIGGLGAGLGQAAIGFIAEESWDAVFYFLMGISLTSVLLLVPVILQEKPIPSEDDDTELMLADLR
mmetsp:Transcript_13091/g.24470  ORF Transcript_13091/g.24470 Transcript_13091/m.24470 type:complete len:451 (-) Transcript_13091:20-1372(-)